MLMSVCLSVMGGTELPGESSHGTALPRRSSDVFPAPAPTPLHSTPLRTELASFPHTSYNKTLPAPQLQPRPSSTLPHLEGRKAGIIERLSNLAPTLFLSLSLSLSLSLVFFPHLGFASIAATRSEPAAIFDFERTSSCFWQVDTVAPAPDQLTRFMPRGWTRIVPPGRSRIGAKDGAFGSPCSEGE